jgi:hypothetical protein
LAILAETPQRVFSVEDGFAVIARKAMENNIRLRFQALIYPVTDSSLSTASWLEFAKGLWRRSLLQNRPGIYMCLTLRDAKTLKRRLYWRRNWRTLLLPSLLSENMIRYVTKGWHTQKSYAMLSSYCSG